MVNLSGWKKHGHRGQTELRLSFKELEHAKIYALNSLISSRCSDLQKKRTSMNTSQPLQLQ
jgi:hypothetical protein